MRHLNTLKISTKLLCVVMIVLLITLGITSVITSRKANQTFLDAAINDLSTNVDLLRNTVNIYVETSGNSALSDDILAAIQKEYAETHTGNSGYFYIVDSSGTFLIHPTLQGKSALDLIDKDGKHFMEELVAQKNGQMLYNMPSIGEQITVFKEIANLHWIVGATINMSDITQTARPLIRTMFIAMILTLVIVMLFIRFSTNYFVNQPLSKMSAMFVNMADGDFSKNITMHSGDEMGVIATNLNATLLKLNGLFTMLKNASVEVNSTAKYVGEANNKMADSAVKQSKSASVMTDSIQKLEQSISSLSVNVETTAQEAGNAHKTAEAGEQVLKLAVDKINNLNTSVIRSSENVDTLAASVEKITEVLKVIDDIAEQTNLLALNAAIEAARAGDSGRGFAVVADEVRKLAEKTVSATLEITTMLHTINTDVKDTLNVMREGVNISRETEETTNELFKEIQSIIELVLSISGKVEGMVSIIHQQSEAASDTTVQVRAVASSADENNQITQENVTKVDSLKNLANRLNTSIASFKLRDTLVEWTPALSVGVSRFDEEHSYLIALINQLYTALQDASGKKVLSEVLDELLNYTNTHFTGEVAQMAKYGWPDIENHKKLHRFFVDKIVKAKQDFESGTAMLGPELMKFLSDWLISHIQKVDTQYTEFFHKHGVR